MQRASSNAENTASLEAVHWRQRQETAPTVLVTLGLWRVIALSV